MMTTLARAAVAVLATLGLTLAGAVAPAAASSKPTIFAVVTGPSTIAAGEATTVHVAYKIGGKPVRYATPTLQKLINGRWVDTTRLHIRSGSGTSSFRPTETSSYRVRNHDRRAITARFTIKVVQPVIGVEVTGPSTVERGQRTSVEVTETISGQPVAAATLVLQRRVGSRWVDAGSVAVKNGKAVRALAPAATTTYRFRTWTGAAASKSFTITVPKVIDRSGETNRSGVGVPDGTRLKVHDGNLTITKAGTVVDGLDIRGFVRVKAKGVTIKNSVIRGPGKALTAPMSLVQADAGADAGLVIRDTTIYAQKPSRFVDGIVGKGFTLERVDIHTVVDQVKITGSNVLVKDSHLHGNLFYPATSQHLDTHDDNVQIAAGSNIRIVGSRLESTTNAAVMITQDRGKVSNFRFEDNRADDGACTINVAEKSYGPPSGLVVVDNVFGTGQRHSRCAILMSSSTSSAAKVSGNTFTDGKTVKVSRGN